MELLGFPIKDDTLNIHSFSSTMSPNNNKKLFKVFLFFLLGIMERDKEKEETNARTS